MQETIPGTEQPPKITERQEIALNLLKESGPLSARELGSRMRVMRGVGAPRYDEENGVAVCKELRAKGLVRRRYRNSDRGPSGWYAVDKRGKAWRAPDESEIDWGGFGE